MTRSISALLKIDPLLSDIELVVVDSGHLAPSIQYDNKQFKIDRRWLTYNGIHQLDPCNSPTPDNNTDANLFTCDHAARLVWDSLLAAATTQGKLELNIPRLRNRAHAIIQQMPRNICYTANEANNEIIVSWKSMEAHMYSTKPMRVTLHWQGCPANIVWADEKIYHTGKSSSHLEQQGLTEIVKKCNCAVKISSVGSGSVSFTGQSAYLRYTAMVSRNEENAIYGIPPAAILIKDLPVEKSTPAEPVIVNANQISQLFTPPTPKDWSKYLTQPKSWSPKTNTKKHRSHELRSASQRRLSVFTQLDVITAR
jgi:hypothetical protein